MKTRAARIWMASWQDRLTRAIEAAALPEHVKVFYD